MTVQTENLSSPSKTDPGPGPSLRVNVSVLDTLMNLAGELVLSRNQLLQGLNSSSPNVTTVSSQRIDTITSELQEAIMKTRMQPIANVLNKFNRVVRDLSGDLKKSVDLVIIGKEVELDKTILESINDPLTHLVRNAVDHGIERPKEREEKGKPVKGQITLNAFHDAGQVNILISDDGRGLDPDALAAAAVAKELISDQQASEMSDKQKTELILIPGFSTAEQISDVSGRGVGMDVVATNIKSLGGILEITSAKGEGTNIQIKLPLTLAIIPSQITSVGDERYAIPQVNLNELLRIPAARVKDEIEMVGDAEVVRLRGELLPLLDLSTLLGIPKTYTLPGSSRAKPDRRINIADRRSKRHGLSDDHPILPALTANKDEQKRQKKDRRRHPSSAVNIAVVSAGAFKYGLIVDQFQDSEEIVVKPIGRHLKECTAFDGATIMGDGKVALILDIASLARQADLSNIPKTDPIARTAEEQNQNSVSLLTFKHSQTEHFAAFLDIVERIERVETKDIEYLGDRRVYQYRGGALPLYDLSRAGDFKPLPENARQEVIVFKVEDKEVGLMVTGPVDAVNLKLEMDSTTFNRPPVTGSMIINGNTTLFLDVEKMVTELEAKG